MAKLLDMDWSALGGLMFAARRLVDGVYAGRHASHRTGMGLDFHDYRPYAPGDNLTHLDWKLLGRTDRHYVRRYRRHVGLHVHLLVDASASMRFSGFDHQGRPASIGKNNREDFRGPSKFTFAATLAAAIAHMTLRQGDRAGLAIFNDRLIGHLPAGGSPAHLQALCATLEKVRLPAAFAPGDLTASLRHFQHASPQRGLVVLLSDLLDEPSATLQALSPLRHHGHDIIALQVLTPQELDLSHGLPSNRQSHFKLYDYETNGRALTDIRQVGRRYAQLMAEHLDTLARGCMSRRIDHHVALTSTDPIQTLGKYLSSRQRIQG